MTKTTKSNTAATAEAPLLTEEQVRAMSEKDYMNAAQMAFFKAKLQQLEKDLLKNAGETTEHLRETVLVPDPADRATIEEEHALELRTRDRERKLLKKVQQSIAAIDAGDYGWCEETGEPIGIPRLIARPTATLSLEAQQRRELKQKLYGDLIGRFGKLVKKSMRSRMLFFVQRWYSAHPPRCRLGQKLALELHCATTPTL